MAQARTKDARAIKELAGRIQSVDDINPYVKVTVFGPNGAGKTRLIASGPKPLILDINEDGTRSAVGSGSKRLEISKWDDIGHAYWLLKGLLDRGKCPWRTLGVDTVTAMYSLAMDFVLEEAEARDPSREKKSPTKRDYGRANKLVEGMILAFKGLDMHVVFTGQMRSIRDDDTGEIEEYAFDLPQGCRGAVTGYTGVVGFMAQQRVKRRDPKTRKVKRTMVSTLTVQPTDEMPFLKDRTNSLGSVVVAPTMPKIIEAWTNINTED